jgi:predicted transposase/invertase (TIGR01784 family)
MNRDRPKNGHSHSHSAYFSWFVSNLDYARDFLSCILPPALLEQLDLSSLRVVSPDQTDSRLRNHRADVLFEVRYRSGTMLLIYLLLEHKSYRDARASFQVLRYIVHQAEDWLRQKKPLRCVLPVVIYNGRRPWSKAQSLQQIFQVPEECRSMFPQFEVSVLDLPRMEGKILQGSADFLAAAALLRSSCQPDLPDQMPAILASLKGHLKAASRGVDTPDSPVPAILRYASTRIPLAEIQHIIEQTFKDEDMIKSQAMKSAAEVWFEEGEAKGRREGFLRGRLIGQIQLLEQLLKRPISTDIQLDPLSIEELKTLAEDLDRQRLAQN